MQVAGYQGREAKGSQQGEKRSRRLRGGASRENGRQSPVQKGSNLATAEIAVGARKTAVGARKTTVGEHRIFAIGVGVRMLDLAAEPCSNARMT